ncbi:MAG: MFS transporter [Clostridia bacterium]|nr:MFS transporter [Clostridia bacterium]
MKKVLNVEYAWLHGTHWMYYGVIVSFASVFLLGNGYSNSLIGVILAIANILAVIIQPLVADLSDKSTVTRSIRITQIMAGVIIIGTAALLLFHGKTLLLSLLFVMLVGFFTSIQPLINSLAFSLENSKVHINFGLSRSLGSIAYSVICAVIGKLVDNLGIETIPVAGFISLGLFIVGLSVINRHYLKACRINGVDAEIISQKQEEERISLKDFAKRNTLFLAMILGVALLFYGNAVLNNFMIQIVDAVGGNEADMGGILGVMAALEVPTMVFFDQINRKFSCRFLLKVAAVGFTVKIFLCYVAKSVFMLYVAQSVQLVAFALLLPAIVKFTDEIMEKGEAVKGQAMFTASTTVGAVIASFTGGWIMDMSSPSMLLLVSTVLSALGTAIICIFIGKIKGKNEI